MASKVRRHRLLKWGWVLFGVVGLVDYFITGTVANSIPVLFALSVAALAIGEWSAEEAANAQQEGGEDDS